MLDAILPPDLGVGITLALLASSFGTSFITAAFGIGGGALLLAILASLLPPTVLIPIHGTVQVGSNLGRAAIMLRHVDWAVVPGFVGGSLLGVALGGSLAVNFPAEAVQVGVGLFIVWSVFSRPPAVFRKWSALTGAFSSFLTMFFGATGPFIASYVKTLQLGREAHVATHSTLMTIQHVLKTIAFGLLGFAFGPWLPFVIAMVAVGFAGTVAGRHVLTRISDARFFWVLKGILLALAARLIWSGASGLAG
jgi:uncharacterized membrane protein YfcA